MEMRKLTLRLVMWSGSVLLLLSRSVFIRLSRSFIKDVSAVISRRRFDDVSVVKRENNVLRHYWTLV